MSTWKDDQNLPDDLAKKIREVYGLKVPRNLVYDMMFDVDPSGLESRRNVGKQKRHMRPRPFTFSSKL
eukprot:gene1126-482_t